MLNIFAANWRDHLALANAPAPNLSNAGEASFHIWSLLQLQTPQAIILLMLGAGVWVFSTLKGYFGFDDPYPDFGKMDRAARDAAEALSEFRGEARLELEDPIDSARAALNARLEKMRAEFEAMNRAFDAASQRMGALDARARALDEAAAEARAALPPGKRRHPCRSRARLFWRYSALPLARRSMRSRAQQRWSIARALWSRTHSANRRKLWKHCCGILAILFRRCEREIGSFRSRSMIALYCAKFTCAVTRALGAIPTHSRFRAGLDDGGLRDRLFLARRQRTLVRF